MLHVHVMLHGLVHVHVQDMYHERAVEAAGELVESWSHTGSSTCDVHPHKGYATGLYE
jgi:hypothetical protein